MSSIVILLISLPSNLPKIKYLCNNIANPIRNNNNFANFLAFQLTLDVFQRQGGFFHICLRRVFRHLDCTADFSANLHRNGYHIVLSQFGIALGPVPVQRLLRLAVLAVCPHLLFDRFSQPLCGAAGLGQRLRHVCAACARGGDWHY